MSYSSQVQVSGGTPAQRTIFYTGLYHMLLSPNLFSDDNGDYIGFDDKVHKLDPTTAYADTLLRSPPSTPTFPTGTSTATSSSFRPSLIPTTHLATWLSLSSTTPTQSGWLPRWPAANDVTYVMGGDSPAVLLSDAYAFGASGFDAHAALRHMLKAATQPGIGPHNQSERPFLADELKLGYIPVDPTRSTFRARSSTPATTLPSRS